MKVSKSINDAPRGNEKLRNFDLSVEEIRVLKAIKDMTHALEDVANECLEAGMDHFMTKPVDPATILSTIIDKATQ